MADFDPTGDEMTETIARRSLEMLRIRVDDWDTLDEERMNLIAMGITAANYQTVILLAERGMLCAEGRPIMPEWLFGEEGL